MPLVSTLSLFIRIGHANVHLENTFLPFFPIHHLSLLSQLSADLNPNINITSKLPTYLGTLLPYYGVGGTDLDVTFSACSNQLVYINCGRALWLSAYGTGLQNM